ncbi:MAG: sigma-54-dependent transcriptional regulator [Myxococcota bacterium]|jgi:two-component system response regulator HydG|nr:sigma-54-dependent Fis family transcriptional regulator [Myxococcota bacterium]MBP8971099.1 sigma-54-dependent Fis family transcriptional regulator [Myxococcota bacterium]OQC42035.1 MAG: Transcriptional regulatory protein ZraR [Deltaproteobacteria bacterium ADurb.Bin058]HHW95818.1 sigma-54-dependent Fis family transcriptional regulator [Oligoflexales bacterium]HQL56038.1 sigma-54 dependent transcriptional regulator [Myxococcota bacterium]
MLGETDKPKLLVVDDDTAALESLLQIFEIEGFEVTGVSDGTAALEALRADEYGVVLSDLRMPGMDGMDLLKTIKTLKPDTEVVIMTAFGTIEKAVEAMREGAYDFVTKPLKRPLVVRSVRRAQEKASLRAENLALRAQLEAVASERNLIGTSAAMRRVLDVISQVAPASTTILIQGESGTGKELVARSIHRQSNRSQGPFVAINCAAIPATLIESELFGHERGAFTGAFSRREGRFKLADGGTLFLDEIADLDPFMQAKLLRVLQEGEYQRLGGSQTLKVDVRVLASTNKPLLEQVKAGAFREDLFYRLNVIAIQMPPLRERMEDVALLAQHFLAKFADKNRKDIRTISRDAMELLMMHDWPGNVRELENTLEHAVVLSRGDTIRAEDLPDLVASDTTAKQYMTIQLGTPLEDIEQQVIQQTLRFTKGNKRLAAQLLGIATRTVYRKVES